MRKIVQTTPLSQRQLFSMKKETLEAKIIAYFEHSKNAADIIQYAVAIMVRNALVCGDFAFICQDLIRQIFMTAKPCDAMRRYCLLFEDYFSKTEWKNVLKRIFLNQREYQQYAEKARIYKNILDAPNTGSRKNLDLDIRLVSVFEDANGKKHTLTLRDADETKTRAQAARTLKILTTLTIFKKADGTRKFVKLVKNNRPGEKDTYDEEENDVDDFAEVDQIFDNEPVNPESVELFVPADFDPNTLTESELLTVVQAEHPEVNSLENLHLTFSKKETEEFILAKPAAGDTIEMPPKATSNSQKTSTLVKDHNAVEVANPPVEPTKKPKLVQPRTNKQGYRFNLIKDWLKRNT
jgi:hypothetical protein